MALTVTIGGVSYSIPEPSDSGYGAALDAYLKAIATGFLPVAGGTSSLTAELDLGSSFGLKSLYLKGRTANPASAGILRLAAADSMGWRNQANDGDVLLSKDAGNALLFNGANVTGNPIAGASTAAGQSITNGATEITVVFGTEEVDTDSAYDNATGIFVVPTAKGGHYFIAAQVAYNTAPTGTCTASIYKNGAALKTTQFIAPGAGQTIAVTADVVLVPTDSITIRTKHGNGAPQNLTATAILNFLSIKRVVT